MMVKGHKLQIRLIPQVNLNELRITSSTSMTPLDISLGKCHWSVAATSESQMGSFPLSNVSSVTAWTMEEKEREEQTAAQHYRG